MFDRSKFCVVGRVEQLPAKLKIFLLSDVELFCKRSVEVPEARGAQPGYARTPRCLVCQGARADRWGSWWARETLIAAKGEAEACRINPLGDSLRSRGGAPGRRSGIANQDIAC